MFIVPISILKNGLSNVQNVNMGDCVTMHISHVVSFCFDRTCRYALIQICFVIAYGIDEGRTNHTITRRV